MNWTAAGYAIVQAATTLGLCCFALEVTCRTVAITVSEVRRAWKSISQGESQ